MISNKLHHHQTFFYFPNWAIEKIELLSHGLIYEKNGSTERSIVIVYIYYRCKRKIYNHHHNWLCHNCVPHITTWPVTWPKIDEKKTMQFIHVCNLISVCKRFTWAIFFHLRLHVSYNHSKCRIMCVCDSHQMTNWPFKNFISCFFLVFFVGSLIVVVVVVGSRESKMYIIHRTISFLMA